MSFRDQVKQVLGDMPVEPQNPFVGYVSSYPQRVRENEAPELPGHPPGWVPGDTFLELLKRRSVNLTYAETSHPTPPGWLGGARGSELARIILQIRQGGSPTELTKALFAAAIRNSMAVYEPQANPNRCHVCAEPEGHERPLVPVLNPAVRFDREYAHHWLHHGCMDEHSRRIAARADAILLDGGSR